MSRITTRQPDPAISAVILAGGASTRMGRDKAWVEFKGRPLIHLAVETVRAFGVRQIFISGRGDQDFTALKCPVLLDLKPGFGPLGGIERALQACSAPLLLVLAVDMPGMTVEFLRQLAGQCNPFTGCVPQLRGRLEPLAAIYPRSCHQIACDFIATSRHVAGDFAAACRKSEAVRITPVKPAHEICFANWNTPSDTMRSSWMA